MIFNRKLHFGRELIKKCLFNLKRCLFKFINYKKNVYLI